MTRKAWNTLAALVCDDSGATVIEYTMIGALVSVAAIASMTLMGAQIATIFGTISAAVTAALG